jgi:putative membrane protein
MNLALKYCTGLLVAGLSLNVQAYEGPRNSPAVSDHEVPDTQLDDAATISSAEVLQKIHVNNLAEIDMGRIVMERAQSEKVRAYGRILVRDHYLMDNMVRLVAKKLRVAVDGEAVNDEVALFKQDLAEMNALLVEVPEEDFHAHLRSMAIEAHQAALDLLNQAQKDAPNLSVRLLATTSEPIIRRHLALAERIE